MSEPVDVGPPEPKDLWIVAAAGHVDLHRAAQEEYERRILLFFEL